MTLGLPFHFGLDGYVAVAVAVAAVAGSWIPSSCKSTPRCCLGSGLPWPICESLLPIDPIDSAVPINGFYAYQSINQVLRRVLVLEAEAERGRVELAAQLEKAAPGDRKLWAAAESACAMDSLRLELANQQVRESRKRRLFSDTFCSLPVHRDLEENKEVRISPCGAQ